MRLGYNYLEECMAKTGLSVTDLSQKLGVSNQAIANWKSSKVIPSKRAFEIAEALNLDNNSLDRLLGVPPLTCKFRTKSGQEFTDQEVSSSVKARAELIYERFFKGSESEARIDIQPLKEKIRDCGTDFSCIAKEIRKFFEFQSYEPINKRTVDSLSEQMGAQNFYLPFSSLKLLDNGCNEQTAVLYTHKGVHSILINSDRTIDEAYFDQIHELIHIFLEGIFEDNKKTEDLIDKIAGELIYPRSYLIRIFFDNDENSRPIKNKEKLKQKFCHEMKALHWIISPRGIARAMRDSGLTSGQSELYKFFNSTLHSWYREHNSITYSELGEMDFDFSNRKALLNFYEFIRSKTAHFRYPLFEKLQDDLISDIISPYDFADTFGLNWSDGIIVKSIWKNLKNA